MFQLIVAVISIALVAALAIASIFYGGDAFTKSSEKAQVTTLINQGQQIAGAAALYKTDNGIDAPSVAKLLLSDAGVQYLADAPNGTKVTTGEWKIDAATHSARIAFADPAAVNTVCDEVGRQVGECIGATGAYTYFSFAL